MTITRLRPAHSATELQGIYAKPHSIAGFPDHLERVNASIIMAAAHFKGGSVGDLSCGDASIALSLERKASHVILGDYAPGYPITGPIEETLPDLFCDLDLLIMCETLEHLDDPEYVLKAAREKSRNFLLSTPVECHLPGGIDTNGEHYWQWDRTDVEDLLLEAGWTVLDYAEVKAEPRCYTFGIWWAE